MCDPNPISIILISSGSRGDRLLFKYPFETEDIKESLKQVHGTINNPYGEASSGVPEDLQANRHVFKTSIRNGILSGYSDKILASLLAVKSLCGRKFELKIDDVVFVGCPLLLHHMTSVQPSPKRDIPTMISFNVVIALRADLEPCVVAGYFDLAKQLSVSLRHEERRCGYLNRQKNIMLSIYDEMTTMPEDSMESPFRLMLRKSQLAIHLKTVYDSLCLSGVVHLYINKWLEINFCLPHKVHNANLPKDVTINPDAIQKCIQALRPYHGMLLLVDENKLVETLPQDSSPSLIRLVRVTTPLKSLQNLAADADLALSQVFQIVSHLVHWAMAIIIYPLCESNVYILSPHTDTYVNSILGEKFVEHFPGMSLPAVMSEFSLPSQLGEHRDVLGLPQQQTQHVQMVVWMLQHRLLIQLHTYVFLVPCKHSASALDRRRPNYNRNLSVEESASWRSRHRDASYSESGSVNSDESHQSVGTFSGFSAKSPSTVEVASDGTVITEETRAQWRLQDNLLSRLTTEQKHCVMSVPAANNSEDIKLFARLCSYFNGRHHLEEIMYYENVRRSQLLTLLDKFRPVLITCQHQDPATTVHLNT